MDQGAAALWAAGIGVGGVVITAGMGWYAARKAAAAQMKAAQETAAAQVEAALAGVREQISGQHAAALWQVRREAYATYLGQIQAVHMGILHLTSLCMVAIDQLGGIPGEAPDLIEPRQQLLERFTDLYFRESALHLAVDEEEAEQAEALRRLAGEAVEDVRDLIEAIYTDHNVGPPQDRAEASRQALKVGIKEWAANARQKLRMAD
ncbi:hypothetical protein ABZ667_16105 [Streptomyces lavendulae]|uniref:hypothetical protein n=1 Tax=Streptomyces lavendulae TaxID=1914 RepID=UPI0033DC49A8